MQPQEPTNPNTTPNQTPSAGVPEPQAPAPAPAAPTPKVTDTPSAGPTTPTPGKKPPMMLIGIVVAVVLAVGAAVAAYFLFFSGIALATYNGDKYSVKYPEGYEQKVEESSVTFNEKGDANTASSVFVYYSEFPAPVEQEQVTLLKDTLKEQMEASIGQATGGNIQIKDSKTEEVKFKGADALQVTGKAERDGKDAGNMKIVMVIDTQKLYMVGVGADISDPGVKNSTDAIINSFTVK